MENTMKTNLVNSGANSQAINDLIYGLEYDPAKILVFKGKKVDNVEPKDGSLVNGKYVVATRTKKMISNDFDVAVPSANLNVTYPGALLLANDKLVDGKPQPLASKRGAAILTLNLPGLAENSTREIPEANYAGVQGALDNILNQWYDNCGGKYQIPANMSFKCSTVYDEESLQLTFGCDVAHLKQAIGIDFDAIRNKTKSVILAEFKQVFYNASIEPFVAPSQAFATSVTTSDLMKAGVNKNNPPAYVSNVVFGRQVYVMFESDVSAKDLSAMVDAAVTVKGVDLSPGAGGRFSNIINRTKVSIVALGGSAVDMKNVALNDATNEINAAILNNVELSPQNPAYPLTYKVSFLKDNTIATFSGSTEYVDETFEEHASGEIHLKHTGAYIAEFYVSWDEITDYDEDGNPVCRRVQWRDNGKNKTSGYSTVITLDGRCRNIDIKAQGKTGLVWDPWKVSINKKGLALVPKRTISISGTTLNQKASCNPEDS